MPYPVPDWVAGTAVSWLSEEASVFSKGPLIVVGTAEVAQIADHRAEFGASILVCVDEFGGAPQVSDVFDVYLTTMPAPPKPWVQVQSISEAVEALQSAIATNPHAAVTLVQVLRAQNGLPFEQALQIESFAYSTLLGGAEFRRWRDVNPKKTEDPQTDEPSVVLKRTEDTLRIELARPENGNALTAELRDALVEALRVARADETIEAIEVRGQGRVFCSGGALDEFGTAQDLALAHHVRTVRSAALALHRVGPRSRIFIQGAAVGGGIEFAAAGHELIAHSSAFFHLPEISMGLIPGAGGTVTIARRIGWQRMAYMALSGIHLRARTALAWGLIDRIDDA